MRGPSRPVNPTELMESERAMAIRALTVTNVALTVVLGAVLTVGCGDDDTNNDPGDAGADSGGSAGDGSGGSKAGSGGSKAGSDTGGKPQGGTAGTAGNGQAGETTTDAGAGAGGTANGGAGGEDPGPDAGGAGGEGGAGTDPDPELAPIIKVSETLHTQANDLRGLFYTETGKLYASGHLGSSTAVDKEIVVARFDENGVPDTTFGGDGFVSFNLVTRTVSAEVVTNDGNEESIGIVELENGDVVVQVNVRDANGKGTDVGLLKLDQTGAKVTTFGTDGLQRLVFGWDPADDALWPTLNAAPSDTSWGIELDESTAAQKIVVFGFGSAAKGQTAGNPAVQRVDTDRYVLRVLASDGSLDPAFNDGKPFFYNSRGTFNDGGRRGFVENDGSIVSAGYTNFGEGLGNHILAIRLDDEGKLDSSFGFGIVDRGVARTNPFLDDGGVAECYALTRQSDGRYVTTGYGSATAANVGSSYGYATTTAADMISVAIKANGKGLDTDWGNFGTRVIQSEEAALGNTEDRGRDLVALFDDRIVYAGKFGPNPALMVATADGQFEPANGLGELITYAPLSGTTSHFYRIVMSKDGTRIASTTSNHADGVKLVVLKVGDE
jgi:uncharacterized delta-60 repeat protein